LTHLMSLALVPKNIDIEESNWLTHLIVGILGGQELDSSSESNWPILSVYVFLKYILDFQYKSINICYSKDRKQIVFTRSWCHFQMYESSVHFKIMCKNNDK